MMEDDVPLRKTPEMLDPATLDRMSIADLQNYIAALQQQIVLVQGKIAAKSSLLGAANAVFGKK